MTKLAPVLAAEDKDIDIILGETWVAEL